MVHAYVSFFPLFPVYFLSFLPSLFSFTSPPFSYSIYPSLSRSFLSSFPDLSSLLLPFVVSFLLFSSLIVYFLFFSLLLFLSLRESADSAVTAGDFYRNTRDSSLDVFKRLCLCP
jgi:hypothetical protein